MKLNIDQKLRELAATRIRKIRSNFTLDQASEKLSINKIYLSTAQHMTLRKKPRRDGSLSYFCPAWAIQRILKVINE